MLNSSTAHPQVDAQTAAAQHDVDVFDFAVRTDGLEEALVEARAGGRSEQVGHVLRELHHTATAQMRQVDPQRDREILQDLT